MAKQKQTGEDGKFGFLVRDEPANVTLEVYDVDAPTGTDEFLGMVHEFPADMLPVAEAAIAKANRRAEKVGLTERFTYTVETFERTGTTDSGFTKVEERARLTLNRPRLGHEDWEFIAKVSHDNEAGVIVHTADGAVLRERPDTQRCDVCGKDRRRNDTYIIEREGEQLQVGGDCVDRFFGVRPSGLWMLDFDLDMKDTHDGEVASRGVDRTEAVETMAVALAAVEDRGWCSRAHARDTGKDATADVVDDVMLGNGVLGLRDDPKVKAQKARIGARARDLQDKAREVIEFVNGMDDDGSEYVQNLKAVVGSPSVSRKNVGIFVSAVAAYERAQGKARERQVLAASKHVGAVGEKLDDVPVTVLATRVMDGTYGPTTLVRMRDGDGNVFTWFASGSKDFAAGGQFRMKATVKKHETYEGVDQTVVTRAKLT